MTEMNPATEEQLDRLVDGELSVDEKRALFTALESDPDGWRRCAMAFLESRAWEESLGETAPAAADSHRLVGNAVGKSDRQGADGRRSGWSNWLSVAALIAAAFGLGVASERLPTSDFISQPIAHDANRGAAPNSVGDESLTLVVDDENGQPRQLQIPIVDEQPGGEWNTATSRDQERFLIEEIRRSGGRLRSRNRYWAPIETSDGRRYVVPIEQWQIDPPTHRQFQ